MIRVQNNWSGQSRTFGLCHNRLLIRLIFCFLTGMLFMMQGCVSVFSDMQSARLVGKGNFEVTPGVSGVFFNEELVEFEHVQNHYGFQTAFGVVDYLDFRLRYESISVSENEDFHANVLGFGPKIMLKRDIAALYLPVGFAFGKDIADESETWEFHPTLLLTPFRGKYLEFNPSVKVLIPFTSDGSDILFAVNLGTGISPNLERFVIRPEVGFLFNPGEEDRYMHLSVGFTVFP